jgi:homoserine acetyltransferase
VLLHGTGSSDSQFLQPPFTGVLFGPGRPPDIDRYFVVIARVAECNADGLTDSAALIAASALPKRFS